MSARNAPVSSSRRVLLPPLFACAGASFVVAGAGVAVWNATDRFAHGWWLASFLTLVGGIAQLLLGAGHNTLRERATGEPTGWPPARQAAVWNAGALLVPLGVLASARLAVVIGSLALMIALAGLSLELRVGRPPARARAARGQAAYVALLTFLSASVLVGTGLAWDLPWI